MRVYNTILLVHLTIDHGTLKFESGTGSVTEGDATMFMTQVNRIGGSCGDITVGFRTISSSATPSTDYTEIMAGQLLFSNGVVGISV